MPKKPQGEILVFRNQGWNSIGFDMKSDSQMWQVFWRRSRSQSRQQWWLGLVDAGMPKLIPNKNLPEPILKAYAFTEWILPKDPRQCKRCTGTHVWVPWSDNEFEIWYSPLAWGGILETPEDQWQYMGTGRGEPRSGRVWW